MTAEQRKSIWERLNINPGVQVNLAWEDILKVSEETQDQFLESLSQIMDQVFNRGIMWGFGGYQK